MQPLDGVRVLDLTQFLSGPYCTMILGDMGADVVKIEKLQDGDDQRRLAPYINGESSPFMMINRNKRSVTLNLKSEEGREIYSQLVAVSDIVVENFRPGVADSLGVGYEATKAVKPEIVYASISGYGQTGPYAHRGGFDLLAQGMTGMMDLMSWPGERPTKMPISVHDIGSGIFAVNGILSAYIHRLKTGVGQYVDVSLVDSGFALTVQESASFLVTGVVPKVQGTRNHLSAPYQAYRAKDGYVLVGAGNQKLWETFCHRVIARPEWIDEPRFVSVSERHRHGDELEELLEEILMQEEGSHWIALMDEHGIPGGPINSLAQAFEDPQIVARDMVPEVDHPTAGRIRTIGIPAKLSETPGEIRLPAPTFGQHTDEVLGELLHLTGQQIAELRTNKVV